MNQTINQTITELLDYKIKVGQSFPVMAFMQFGLVNLIILLIGLIIIAAILIIWKWRK